MPQFVALRTACALLAGIPLLIGEPGRTPDVDDIRADVVLASVAAEQDAAHAHAEPTVGVPVSLHPAVVVEGASTDQRSSTDEALARFRAAGLLLPDVEIVFHDDPSGCKGHDGLFQDRFTPWRVLVCSDLAYVLTHELAHAWEAANLDDVDRHRYVESRNLRTWNAPDAAWGDRGVEDAAFVLQQNLMAGSVDAASDRWVERSEAYRALTGRPSPVLSRGGSLSALASRR